MSGPVPSSQVDGLYQLNTETTRRKFLSTFATSGMGLTGLQVATERVFGKNPDGKPIVWRYDRFGNPETIRYISEERYRRIQVYENIHPRRFYKRADGVNGIRLEQRSEDSTDLVLKVYLDQNTRFARQNLPNRVKHVPIKIEERKTNRKAARICDRRHDNFYDPLPANPKISTYDSNGDFYDSGTLGVACWNSSSDSPYKCYITAAHVAEDGGSYADYLHHAGEDDSGNFRSQDVGEYVTHSPLGDYGMDVVKFRKQNGTVSPDIRGNADNRLGSLAGTWTHAGLTDRTTNSQSLSVKFAGCSTCYATTDCTGTSKTSLNEYQADYSPNEVTDGDSGGPFLDNDDYLVGIFSHFCESCEQSHGPTGQELLDRVNAQLTNPRLQ